MHTVRQARLQFGETLVITGLGTLGQMIARTAYASNYRVIGVEMSEERLEVLQQAGVHTDALCKNNEELKSVFVRYMDGFGSGRCDQVYERQGVDYSIGYARWTEGRNLADYLRMVDEGRIDMKSHIACFVQ